MTLDYGTCQPETGSKRTGSNKIKADLNNKN